MRSLLKRLILMPHILYEAIVRFFEDQCYVRASLLTFYSLLSVVPLLALLLGIAKGFGFEAPLESQIQERFAEQQVMMQQFIAFARSALENARSGVIASVGTLLLIWSVFGLLSAIETALNEIWSIERPRSLGRKITDYLAMIAICPLFLVLPGSINLFVITQLEENTLLHPVLGAVSPYVLLLVRLSPVILTTSLFTLLYALIPNTHVRWSAALFGGLIAGISYQIWQSIYLRFQIEASSYGAIYGSFAALPLFLIWLQASWLIVLAGAELSAAFQKTSHTPNFPPRKISRYMAALLILKEVGDAFELGTAPITLDTLIHRFGFDRHALHRLLDTLKKDAILAETTLQGNDVGYLPAVPMHKLTYLRVWETMAEEEGVWAHPDPASPPFQELESILAQWHGAAATDFWNRPLVPDHKSLLVPPRGGSAAHS